MTRTVFDNDMVAHVWAQQSQSEGRSHNGNFSFEGDTLYSYRTPIGRFISIAGEGVATLVTSETYSITTSGKHMRALWRAIAYNRHAFTVPTLGEAWRCGRARPLDHAANLAHLQNAYTAHRDRIVRLRDYYGDADRLENELEALAETANRYARLFGLIEREYNPEVDAQQIMAKRAEREAKFNAPGAAEKREAAREARQQAKLRKAEEQRRQERLTNAEKLAEWRAGGNPFLPHGARIDEAGGALLRVKGDWLETSLGACVPLADAIKVFRFVKLCRQRGPIEPGGNIAWKRNGSTLSVGHFQVDWISITGTFRAGCHMIHWEEIEGAAIAAGVLDIAPEDTRDTPQAA